MISTRFTSHVIFPGGCNVFHEEVHSYEVRTYIKWCKPSIFSKGFKYYWFRNQYYELIMKNGQPEIEKALEFIMKKETKAAKNNLNNIDSYLSRTDF